jgi:DNA-binding NarL/FixJ family response regulator
VTRICHVYTLMTQPLLELGLQTVFEGEPDYEFHGAFRSLTPLCDAIRTSSKDVPCIVFMDFVQDIDAYPQILQTLRQSGERVRCLLLMFPFIDEQTLIQALRAGADGYLLQSANPSAIVEAATTLTTDQSYLDPLVTPRVLEELRKPRYFVEEPKIQVELTQRERILMQLTADGLGNTQIADVLGLREKTIRNMWSALFDKLGIYDRTLVVLWAIRTGYVELR